MTISRSSIAMQISKPPMKKTMAQGAPKKIKPPKVKKNG